MIWRFLLNVILILLSISKFTHSIDCEMKKLSRSYFKITGSRHDYSKTNEYCFQSDGQKISIEFNLKTESYIGYFEIVPKRPKSCSGNYRVTYFDTKNLISSTADHTTFFCSTSFGEFIKNTIKRIKVEIFFNSKFCAKFNIDYCPKLNSKFPKSREGKRKNPKNEHFDNNNNENNDRDVNNANQNTQSFVSPNHIPTHRTITNAPTKQFLASLNQKKDSKNSTKSSITSQMLILIIVAVIIVVITLPSFFIVLIFIFLRRKRNIKKKKNQTSMNYQNLWNLDPNQTSNTNNNNNSNNNQNYILSMPPNPLSIENCSHTYVQHYPTNYHNVATPSLPPIMNAAAFSNMAGQNHVLIAPNTNNSSSIEDVYDKPDSAYQTTQTHSTIKSYNTSTAGINRELTVNLLSNHNQSHNHSHTANTNNNNAADGASFLKSSSGAVMPNPNFASGTLPPITTVTIPDDRYMIMSNYPATSSHLH